MKKLVILSYGHFPQGGASSIRLCSIAKLFISKDFDVFVIAMGDTQFLKWEEYDSIKYISIRSESKKLLSRVGNVMKYKSRVKKILEGLGHIDAFLLSGVFPSVFDLCEEYYRTSNTMLFTDCTEWYSSTEFSLGVLSPEYLRNTIINTKKINKKWKTISISRFFEDYFSKKGISTVRIPAIMDTSEFEESTDFCNRKRVVVYAGSPAKKDAIDLIVQGFANAEETTKDGLELHIIGMTQDQFAKNNKAILIPQNVVFYGRLSREEVKKHLMQSDFTTIMRNDKERYSKAGFPSKVAESLSAGIPVITNYTSDLNMYLVNGVNSIIVPGFTCNDYTRTLIALSTLSDEDIRLMKKKARELSVKYFDYRNYDKQIEQLINS